MRHDDENDERRALYSDCSATAIVIVLHKVLVYSKMIPVENWKTVAVIPTD